MQRWFAGLIDPFPSDRTAPPRTFWAFLRWALAGSEKAVGLLLVTSMLTGLAEAAGALLTGWAVDATATGEPATFLADHWLAITAILAFFLVIRPVLMIMSSGFVSVTLAPGLFPLSIWRIHRHTLGQSLRFFEDDFAGRISQKQMQTSNATVEAVTEFVNSISFGAAAVIGAVAVLGGADWRLMLALLGWFAVYAAWVTWMLPKVRRRAAARAEARASLSGQLVDTLSNMPTVKLFAHTDREEAAAHGSIGRYRAAALAFGTEVWRFRTGLAILGGILPAALIGGAIWLWTIGQGSPGVIAIAAMLSTRLSQMSGWLSFTAMQIFANIGIIEDGMRTLTPAHGMRDAPDAETPRRVAGALEFEDVHFGYGREEGGGLHGVTLSIAPGERVGLVGRSGAGKSTLIRLLARLDDVEQGRILLDGRDIRDLTQEGLRKHISVVTQDTAMFNRSALDNILYGRPDAGSEAAVAAARQARADHFIRDLADPRGRTGYEAHLGERGVKLSGGQRQRIALARAVLQDPRILILDDATSAVDARTEEAINEGLRTVLAGRT
ncbi:MAG TPA: ABC transporter ATP-binding protein, partial [Paracoccaceae bacterium]|nr:ABC transporter ATP-binding protein [Paracoccaceae bacterium]